MDFRALNLRLHSLTVLRSLLHDYLLSRYIEVLQALETSSLRFSETYGALCQELFLSGDFSDHLADLIKCDNNALTQTLANPPAPIRSAADADLQTLHALTALDGEALIDCACNEFPDDAECFLQFPRFASGTTLPFKDSAELIAYYTRHGYGVLSQASFFIVENDQIIPVYHPDPIRLTDLKGYASQKAKILENTSTFLNGLPSNNILLYGDKGTGKSSTIKAVGNEFAARGLKLIELSSRQINMFPKLYMEAERSPFHIIVFLDDLSFDHEDTDFELLKAFIEGGVTEKPTNLLLYATSNRRHLIRERLSDREGDDVHIRDTLETLTSLSDRFGLEITFSVPEKNEYLDIVGQLAAENELDIPENELHLLAERFALRKNGRSPRTAQQFIKQQLALRNNTTP